MTIIWRRKLPGEFDHEALWGCIALIILMTASFFPFDRLPIGIPCWFRALSGFPCPSCSSTRAFVMLAHGRIAEGFALNPAAGILFFSLLLFLPYAFCTCLLRKPRLRIVGGSPHATFIAGLCAAVLMIGNWAYLMLSQS